MQNISTQKEEEPKKAITSQQDIQLLMAEYTALREQIVKRIEIEYQLLALDLIAPGTIITIGFQTNNPSIMLLYPALAWLLSSASLSNLYFSHYMAAYIKNTIEAKVRESNIGYEHFVHSATPEPFLIVGFLAARGIFIATELISLVAGIFIAKFDAKETLFLIIRIACTVCNIAMIVVLEDISRGWRIKWPNFKDGNIETES